MSVCFWDDLPLAPVAPMHLEGDEPSLLDEHLRRAQCRSPVPDGVGAIDANIPRRDGGLGPVFNEPIQQFFGISAQSYYFGFGPFFFRVINIPCKETRSV